VIISATNTSGKEKRDAIMELYDRLLHQFPVINSLEVFAIKDSKCSSTGKEAFIGYKLKTGCFHFIQVPYTNNDI
jgi:hypothetical protein